MSEIIIIGAGAIGRGYLPWILAPGQYDYIFIDTNEKLITQMAKAQGYTTYRVQGDSLEKIAVKVHKAYLPQQFDSKIHKNAIAAFVNVGPRNVVDAAKILENLNCPVILSENDPGTVDLVKSSTRLKSVYFAVPDVITSNTAPPHLLKLDPLSVISENGVMFIDQEVKGLKGEYQACTPQELQRQWTAKLYLHNTPHCVAAYLGALVGNTYVHEAMQNSEIKTIVSGAMTEMLNSLKLNWDIPHRFLDWYADKELKRFSNALLYDPISRVAREPLRKLDLQGRLIGAAEICLSLGFIPEHILLGITAALLFNNENDADRHLAFMRRALSSTTFLTHVLSLRKGEALECVLSERLERMMSQLKNIRVKKQEK